MQHRRSNSPRPAEDLRLFGAGCLLLLYLGTATPLAAALTALLASIDRSHHVAIQQTANGVQVVLRHQCANSPSHRHGMVARALTFFAQRATPGQPDHVLQFRATDTVRESCPVAVEPQPCVVALETNPANRILPDICHWFRCAAAFARPPPVAFGFLLTLRSTTLIV